MKGHEDTVSFLCPLLDGRLASGSYDATIKIWNLKIQQCEATLNGHGSVSSLCLLPDGRLASGSMDKTIKIWNLKTQQCEAILKERGSVYSLCLLPDGRLASGSHGIITSIKIWNLKTQQSEETFNDCSTVFSLCLLPDGRLASGSIDNTIKIWNIKTQQCEAKLQEHKGWVNSLCLLSDGTLVSGSTDKTIKIWDIGSRCLTEEEISMVLQSNKPISPNKMNQEKNDLLMLNEQQTVQKEDLKKNVVIEEKPTKSTTTQSIINIISESFVIPYNSLKFTIDTTTNKPIELGSGGFGTVYKGTWQYTAVAIKQLHAQTLTEKVFKEFEQESAVMTKLTHPNVLHLHGICIEVGKYSMVLEYMSKGSLFKVLHSNHPLSLPQLWQIAMDIGKGIFHLHSKKILHRDLKSLNVLLDANLQAKVCDFGLSQVKIETKTVSKKNTSNQTVGTTRWMAPELFDGKKYTEKADVYSYGIILWELFTRKIPYENFSEDLHVITYVVLKGKREKIPENTPSSYAKLIQWCWQEKPEERPTVQQALELLEQNQHEATLK